MTFLSGVHAPNSHFEEADYEIIRLSGCRAVRLFWYHTADEVARLRALGVTHFTVRLQNSVWERADGTEYIPSYQDYGEALIERALFFYHLGILDFEPDCEPNISWRPHHLGGWDYRAFITDVLDVVRPRLPLSVRLGFPSVSFAAEWLPMEWLGPLKDTAPLFDWLAVHSYYQSDKTGAAAILAGPLNWIQFGGNYRWYETWQPGMPIQITEYGNSIQEQGIYTPAQVDAFRAEQYPLYLRELSRHPQIEVAYCFICGGTPDWEGFRVSEDVARAMSPAQLQGQSQVLGGGRAEF